MNSLTLTGNLGKDAEVRYMTNGDPVLSFSVGDNQGKDKPTIWWNCSIFGKRAESLAPYLVKGQQVTVVGNVTERTYTDKNGQERKAQDVRVQDIALQGSKQDRQERQERQEAPAPRAAAKPAGKPKAESLADMEDDIPF